VEVGEPERIAALSSYVPQAVLRFIARSPAPDARPRADQIQAALLLVDITGFTRLTSTAVRGGPAEVEGLSHAVNRYLGRIIDLIAAHGGDVCKILGDALLPVWPAIDEDLAAVTHRAALCGLAIASELGEVEVERDLRLAVKIGLSAGEVSETHLGGLDGRWGFLIGGEGVSDLSALERRMRTGDVVATPPAWALIADRFVGQPLDLGHVRIGSTSSALEPRPLVPALLQGEREAEVRAYIPRVILARLDAGQADWLAELRRTTVVFAAVRGIATESAAAVGILQQVTLAAQRVLARYDGWLKEVTIDEKGTTLVAVFGVAPFSHEDDPGRAVEAGMAIVSAVGSLGRRAGVGIASGTAICGPVGNARRRDLAVLGQHVNLAARLAQAAGDDELLIDTETHHLVRGERAYERLPAYVLKGMSAPIDVYRVRSPAAATEAPATALVGRIAELGVARDAIEWLTAGMSRLAVVEGEPGIGKSRFVAEWERLARGEGVRTLVGEAVEIESATPYHAWRAVFERIFGLEGVTDREQRRRRVSQGLAADAATARLAPLLNPILAPLDLADNEVTGQFDGEVRADNTRDLLIRTLRAQTSAVPLMIVLEDAHWLDSASWALALRAAREVPSLLIVVTMRPLSDAEEDPIAGVRGQTTSVRLGPLSREDCVALACQRTGATRMADTVAAIVEQRAEGNPLFIEQLTYAMRDTGRVVVDGGLLRPASGPQSLDGSIIPDTVQRLITTRLDQLPPAEAMTIKVASVIGKRFSLRTLADIHPVPTSTEELTNHLRTLSRLALVAPASTSPEPTFEFSHVITQEVAYNLMLSAQSRELHRGLARWYERTYASDLSPFHAFLAHHWQRAGEAERAVDYLDLAGGQALRTFANEEAIDFLEQALKLDEGSALQLEPVRRARRRLQLGEAYVHMSRYNEGRAHLETGLRLMGQPAPAGAIRQGTAVVVELVRQALHRVRVGPRRRRLDDQARVDLVAAFRAFERLAEASYYASETLLPLYCVIRILNEAEASRIPAEIARGLAGTGALLGLIPLPRIAEWYLGRALAQLGEVDDLTTHEIVEIVVGFYQIGAGRWEPARERFRSVRGIARRLGDRRRLEDALANAMELENLAGDFRAASELADELTAAASAEHDPRYVGTGHLGRAYAAWQTGDMSQAMAAARAVRELLAGETELPSDLRASYSGLMGLIHLGRGEHQAALGASDEAFRLTGQRPTFFGTFLGYVGPADVYLTLLEQGHPFHNGPARTAEALARMRKYAGIFPIGRPRSAMLEGRHRWLSGSRRGALASWRRALALAETLSMPFEAALAHLELARHLDDGDERAIHLAAASETLRRLEVRRVVADVETMGPSAEVTQR
jgi:class 3 adenylate cyclase/tetratricopeptide (TPR) repeat protein